ncbi:hypothetical protein A2U01_0068494 [Trifolium medium]|uniref:Uncharacterized protein n=1 Tax=Trifolium medium TaxID=97028 RepID=A0A392SE80_9FABA|nr:hypothetical protein [Trifolium medium]
MVGCTSRSSFTHDFGGFDPLRFLCYNARLYYLADLRVRGLLRQMTSFRCEYLTILLATYFWVPPPHVSDESGCCRRDGFDGWMHFKILVVGCTSRSSFTHNFE